MLSISDVNAAVIYTDRRWEGDHGIGRFAAEVSKNYLSDLNLKGNPASPFDSVLLSLATWGLPKGSIFFSPGYNAPLFTKVPFVFTVHDLNHIDRPENSSLLKRLYYSIVLKRACRRAAFVLTVSDFSKNRIVEWSGISRDKVINVGGGVDSSFRIDVQPYEVGYPYLLCVSNRKGHKNEFRVVDAFQRADLPSIMRLVFTGHPTEQLLAHITSAGVSERVHFVGRVPEAKLPSLYKGAKALLFPSLYEGFGLPVIEAMACGTPVITSNRTSLPEVAGEAALLVNPESVEQISKAITRVVSNEALRSEMSKKGLEQAAKFKWEKTAQLVFTAVTSVVAQKCDARSAPGLIYEKGDKR